MSNITHESHYVPKASLRRWSRDGTHVYAYRILVSRPEIPEWELKSIGGIAFQEDLYTIFAGGEEGDEFERWITREYEEPGLDAIDKLLDCARLNPSDWRCMARFVAAQDVRTPLNFIESMKRWQQEIPAVLDKCLQEAVERLSRGTAEGIALACRPEPSGFAESLRIQIDPSSEASADHSMVRVEVSAGRKLWIASMRHLLTGAANALCQHRWSVAEPHGNEEFPLTDHPVLRLNYYRPEHYDFLGGWGNKGSEIMMPLSPRHLLYVQVGRKAPNRFVFSEVETHLVQRLMGERAHRWVFARQPVTWVAQVRPRIVDQQAFLAEQDAWKQWHEAQLKFEVR